MSEEIEELISNHRYDEALGIIEKSLQSNIETLTSYNLKLYQCKIYESTSEYDLLKRITIELINEIEPQYTEQYIRARHFRVMSYYRTGELDAAFGQLEELQEFVTSTDLLKSDERQRWIAYLQFTSGNLFYYRGDLESALNRYLQSKELWIELDDGKELMKCDLNIGTIQKSLGNFDKAMEIFQEALKNDVLRDNQLYLSFVYNNIGTIYQAKGELFEALKSHEKSLEIKKKSQNKDHIATSYNNIGMCHVGLGDYQKGISYLQKSLRILKQIGNPWEITETAFYIIDAYVRNNTKSSIQQAQQLFSSLKPLQEEVDNPRMELFYNLAQAIMLNVKSGSRNRVKAMDILEDIIDEDVIDYWITTIAIEYYTLILLDEYKLYERQDTLDKISDLINLLLQFGKDNFSFPIVIKSLILKSNLKLLKGNISESYEMLEQASIICLENDLISLQRIVERHEKQLKEKLKDWESIIANSQELRDEMDKEIMEGYIENVKTIFSK